MARTQKAIATAAPARTRARGSPRDVAEGVGSGAVTAPLSRIGRRLTGPPGITTAGVTARRRSGMRRDYGRVVVRTTVEVRVPLSAASNTAWVYALNLGPYIFLTPLYP